MSEEAPRVARTSPCKVSIEAGKQYFWCSCGLSENQPFCDGSHKDTRFAPLRWKPERDGEVWLCACKRTKKSPLCDGTHNRLKD